MAVIPILRYPHPLLAAKAEDVSVFDDALRARIDDMAETMYAANGVGLAATQIGRMERVVVIDTALEGETSHLWEMVNPRIVERSDDTIWWKEGCLSIPEVYEQVKRSARVTAAYRDRNGEERTVQAEGLLSVCIQHELDHLDGVVFLDRLPTLARELALRKYRKLSARRK